MNKKFLINTIIVLFIVFVLLALLIPNFLRARSQSSQYRSQTICTGGSGYSRDEGRRDKLSGAACEKSLAMNQVASDLPPSRLVIKTGSLSLVVDDVAKTAREIVAYAESINGWVVSSSIAENNEVPVGGVTIRIPASDFDSAIKHIAALAKKVDREEIQGQDVTEEYVDLQSRLRNLSVTEAQLLKIMNRSGKIPEVLEAMRELTRVREESERLKGRMEYLEKSARFSTISVNLALSCDLLPIPPAEKWQPKYVAKRAWRSLQATLRLLSYLTIWLAVYAIIWVPFLLIIVWIFRRKKKN